MAYMTILHRDIFAGEKTWGFFAKTSTPEARKEDGGGEGEEGRGREGEGREGKERVRQIRSKSKSKSVGPGPLGNGSGKEESTVANLQ